MDRRGKVFLFYLESHTPAEFLQHVQFHIFEMFLLKDLLLALEANAALQLLDGDRIAEKIGYLIDPLGRTRTAIRFRVALRFSPFELIADGHVLAVRVWEVVVDEGLVVLAAMGRQVLHLQTAVGLLHFA